MRPLRLARDVQQRVFYDREHGLALACGLGMFNRIAFLSAALLFVGACGGKAPPKSTTTTSTQTEKTTDTGDKTSVDTTQTVTEQPDGSTQTKKTETTNTNVPAPK